MKRQQRVIAILAIGYALLFLLWRVIEALPRIASWWPLRISEIFGVWALLPLPILVVAAYVWRVRWVWIALLVPTLWFVSEYGGLFVPSAFSVAHASTENRDLRMMTFNTKNLSGDSQDFMDVVEKWQPDVIVLQEVNPYLIHQLSSLAKVWPYHEHALVRVNERVAIFSKWPILSFESDKRWLGCHCAQAQVDWNGKNVRVILVHIRAPSLGPRRRSKLPALNRFDDSHQAISYDELISHIEVSREPVIVLGDFNTTERQAGYHRLYAAGLKDAHEEAGLGLGLTFPAPFTRFRWLPFSLVRIDHVFYSSAWRAIGTRTMPLIGSDHQALIADLQWVGDQ